MSRRVLRLARSGHANLREAILDAAERRFADEGYAVTTLESIGLDVGAGRSAVLYHFREKRELYREVLERIATPLLEKVQKTLLSPRSFRERLERLVDVLVEEALANPNLPRIAMRELPASTIELREEIRAVAERFRLIDPLVEAGIAEGVLSRNTSADVLLSMLAGPVLYFFCAIPTYGRGSGREPTGEEIERLRTALKSALAIFLPPSDRDR